MDRLLSIIQDGEEIFRQYFGESILLIQEEYRDTKYIKRINDQISFVLNQANQEGKEEIRYFGIMYLNSSLWLKTYELLFGLYNEAFYLDPKPKEYFYQIPLFFEEFDKNMLKVLNQIKNNYSRVQPYEVEQLEKKCINYYYAAIYKFLCDVQEEMIVPSNVILYWGRYQGEATIINGGQL